MPVPGMCIIFKTDTLDESTLTDIGFFDTLSQTDGYGDYSATFALSKLRLCVVLPKNQLLPIHVYYRYLQKIVDFVVYIFNVFWTDVFYEIIL